MRGLGGVEGCCALLLESGILEYSQLIKDRYDLSYDIMWM